MQFWDKSLEWDYLLAYWSSIGVSLSCNTWFICNMTGSAMCPSVTPSFLVRLEGKRKTDRAQWNNYVQILYVLACFNWWDINRLTLEFVGSNCFPTSQQACMIHLQLYGSFRDWKVNTDLLSTARPMYALDACSTCVGFMPFIPLATEHS